MASLDRRLNPLYAIKECSSCGNLHTKDCGCSKGSLEDKILVPVPDSSQRPLKIENFCLNCGDPVHGLYCRQCALIRKTLEEVFQDFQDTSNSSDDDTNFVNQEPFVVKQGPGVNTSQSNPHIDHYCYRCGDSLDDIFCQRCTCESCGKGAHYGYNCPPKIPIISKPEPCNNQTVNEFPQTLPSVHPTSCSGNENLFTYDSKPNFVDNSPNVFNPPPQPPMYSCEFCGNDARYGHYCTPQKEEEKRIAEEQAAKDRYWKIPICYDDDEDYTIAITPVLPTKEPVNSLSMGDEHLDTIPATESDEVIKSSVENLVPIPTFKEHSETIINSNNDYSLSDDDSYENIDYVDASPPDAEIVSLEVVEIVIPEVGGIDDDILLTIKDDILREKLLNVNLLIANIEALKDNPTPSSDFVTKSSSTSLNLFLEETNTFDNSSPESETFCFNLEEISSGSTTTHADFSQYDSFIFDLSINPFPPADRSDFNHEEFAVSFPSGTRNKIFDPGILDRNKIYDPRICIEVESTRFLATFSPVIDTLLPFSSENKDKVFNHGVLASKEKSPPSSSHRGFKDSKLFHQKSPMLIHGGDIPTLDVPFLHFYPP
ncbi:hypothetical protein Tco_0808681 [Tanacetum coccineum]